MLLNVFSDDCLSSKSVLILHVQGLRVKVLVGLALYHLPLQHMTLIVVLCLLMLTCTI